jgi:dTDP-4-amino-4,6-dideoxygalactose transaminase
MSADAWERYTAHGSWAYRVLAPGYNYAMSDLQAALGHAQFARVDEFQRKRRDLAERYQERLAPLPDIIRPLERPGTTHAWHLYVIRLAGRAAALGRERMIEGLRRRGIGTSVHFIPIHHHPYYREAFGWAPGDFPQADHAFETMISLPLYTRMTGAEVDRVVAAVDEIVRDH